MTETARPRGAEPDRRAFLRTAGAGALGVGLGGSALPAPAFGRGTPVPSMTAPALKLGVASYSLREFDRAYVIRALKELGTPYVNLKSFHQPYEGTPAELSAGRAELEAAGLRIVGGGTVTLQTDTDEDVRRYFEYARLSGMPLMVIAPTRETLPRIERFAREYDIAVAIHNHGPEDVHFPGPQDILPVVADMDPRVGVCLDVGHAVRTGIALVEAADMCGSRLLDVHMKDLADPKVRESQCIVGEGVLPVGAFFQALIRMGYDGCVNLEYEIDPSDPLPGMRLSFAYMRGVLTGLAA